MEPEVKVDLLKLKWLCLTNLYTYRTSHVINLTIFQQFPVFLPLWFKFAVTTLFTLCFILNRSIAFYLTPGFEPGKVNLAMTRCFVRVR